MRYSCLTLAGTLLYCAALGAQQPAPQPPATPSLDPNNRLDSLLMQWEAKMKSIQTLKATVSRDRQDNVFKTRDLFVGEAKYMKPNFALLDLRRKDGQPIFEKYICTGTYLYEFNQANREVRVQELPPPNPGQVAEDNFLSFVFGMKAEEAKRRYELNLVGDGKDKNYHYVEILPRFLKDKADFQKAQLVLTQSTLLPRMLTFVEPNGNRITWDIPAMEAGAALRATEFTQPAVPPGWKLVQAPKANTPVPPRVVRPKQP